MTCNSHHSGRILNLRAIALCLPSGSFKEAHPTCLSLFLCVNNERLKKKKRLDHLKDPFQVNGKESIVSGKEKVTKWQS